MSVGYPVCCVVIFYELLEKNSNLITFLSCTQMDSILLLMVKHVSCVSEIAILLG